MKPMIQQMQQQAQQQWNKHQHDMMAYYAMEQERKLREGSTPTTLRASSQKGHRSVGRNSEGRPRRFLGALAFLFCSVVTFLAGLLAGVGMRAPSVAFLIWSIGLLISVMITRKVWRG